MSNDTRQVIADAEWASVERHAMLSLDELEEDGGGVLVSEEVGTIRAYIDGLKARHERRETALTKERDQLAAEVAAYREVAALANRDRANALAERDEERRLRLLAAEHAQGVQAGYQRDLDALRAAVAAYAVATLARLEQGETSPAAVGMTPAAIALFSLAGDLPGRCRCGRLATRHDDHSPILSCDEHWPDPIDCHDLPQAAKVRALPPEAP